MTRSTSFWLSVAAFGLLVRVWLWWASEGSNDIRTWQHFGRMVARHGLGDTYVLDGWFNHPPLMGLWGAAASKLYLHTPLTFAQFFKLPSLLAECGTSWLLFRIAQRAGGTLRGVQALALYAVALSPILISSYHGNTDAIYFYAALLAAFLIEGRARFFLAGLALGAAINVKLIPIFLALPLATRCRTPRHLVLFAAGGVLAMTPFAISFASFDAAQRGAFLRNIFGYGSLPEFWGVEGLVRALCTATRASLPEASASIRRFGDWYLGQGGKLLLGASLVIAVWQLLPGSKRLDAYRLEALVFSGFLFFASGFGVQYTGAPVAALLAFWLFGGTLVGLTTGLAIGIIYLHYVVSWRPIYSHHYSFPADFFGFTSVAWVSLFFVWSRIVAGRSSSAEPRAGRLR